MIKKITAAVVCLLIAAQIFSVSVFADTADAVSVQPPDLKAESAILMDQNSGKILFEKDSHKKMYPASITKVLTALLVLENLNLEDIITVGREINLTELDASISGLKVGEKLTGYDLIWAMMLPSGNDAAYTAAVSVARKLAGDSSLSIDNSVKAFVELMNKRAKEIGAKESNFANPDGYHLDDHYSTAYDLALISRAAMENEFFSQVVKTYDYKLRETSGTKTNIKDIPTGWINKNKMINKNSEYYYQYVTGIKTGHTSKAGYCLAASAKNDDISLISIVLKDNVEQERWEDTRSLFEYGFNNFKYYTVIKKGDTAAQIQATRKYLNDKIKLNAILQKDFTELLSHDEFKSLTKTIKWNAEYLEEEEADGASELKLKAPIKSGQVIGTISYELNGKTIVESELTADREAKKGNYSDVLYSMIDFAYTYKFVIIGAVVLLGAFIIFVLRARAARKNQY